MKKTCFNAKQQMADKRFDHTPSARQNKLFKYILAAAKANRDTEEVTQINEEFQMILWRLIKDLYSFKAIYLCKFQPCLGS